MFLGRCRCVFSLFCSDLDNIICSSLLLRTVLCIANKNTKFSIYIYIFLSLYIYIITDIFRYRRKGQMDVMSQ